MSLPVYPLLRRHTILQLALLAFCVLLFLSLWFSSFSPSAIVIWAVLCGIASSCMALLLMRFIDTRKNTISSALEYLSTGNADIPVLPESHPDKNLRHSINALQAYVRQQREHHRLLLEALQDINTCTTSNDMLWVIAKCAKQLTKAKYTALATFRDDSSIDQFITLGMTAEQERGISRRPEGKGLLGHIQRIQQPLMTANLNTHPESAGFPTGHPPMTSLLAVPILSGNTSLGNLYVTDKIGASEFNESDKHVLLLLAQISAVILSYKAAETAMGTLVSQTTEGVAVAATTTERISASVDAILQAMRNQTSQTAGAAAATEEMNSTISENLRTTTGVVAQVKETGDNARESSRVLAQTIDSMNRIAAVITATNTTVEELAQSSSKIGDIVSIISDIASQTNLLALNAAIEAARAGTAGRGFAVVADEVKKLSDKTAHEIRTISDTVTLIQRQTQKSHESMRHATSEVQAVYHLAGEAEKALAQITNNLRLVTDGIVSVAAASEQQARTSNSIAGTIEELSSLAEHTTKQLESIALSVDELNSELMTWNT